MTRVPRPAKPLPDDASVVVAALDELGGGAVVVLDAALRIVSATPTAERLLGTLPRGKLAAKVLCGSSATRPVAEALAAGRPVRASIPNPTGGGRLRVRGIPIDRHGVRLGWAMLFEEEPADADAPTLFHDMWTADAAMKRMFRIIEKVAKGDATVLVRGETGVGKELVSLAIHALSKRANGPFRAINCAAVPQALLESELFGHVKGAFTGAVRDVPGHFRLADQGTLFLDEVAEMPLDLQAKMLRVLETREITPVGGSASQAVDVRVIAATHRRLRNEVEAGRFRADLMYRLRVIPLFIPPLRSRTGDVNLLTQKLIDELNARGERQIARVSVGAQAAMERYDWPGNIRELRNALEYAYAIGEGALLVEADLPQEIVFPDRTESDGAILANRAALPLPGNGSAESVRLLTAINRAGGSRQRAAKSLGMSRVTLWRKMRDCGLLPPPSR